MFCIYLIGFPTSVLTPSNLTFCRSACSSLRTTFPKIYYNESIRGPLARWNGVPGFNILENIYREEVDRKVYHPYKMILQPR